MMAVASYGLGPITIWITFALVGSVSVFGITTAAIPSALSAETRVSAASESLGSLFVSTLIVMRLAPPTLDLMMPSSLRLTSIQPAVLSAALSDPRRTPNSILLDVTMASNRVPAKGLTFGMIDNDLAASLNVVVGVVSPCAKAIPSSLIDM